MMQHEFYLPLIKWRFMEAHHGLLKKHPTHKPTKKGCARSYHFVLSAFGRNNLTASRILMRIHVTDRTQNGVAILIDTRH